MQRFTRTHAMHGVNACGAVQGAARPQDDVDGSSARRAASARVDGSSRPAEAEEEVRAGRRKEMPRERAMHTSTRHLLQRSERHTCIDTTAGDDAHGDADTAHLAELKAKDLVAAGLRHRAQMIMRRINFGERGMCG